MIKEHCDPRPRISLFETSLGDGGIAAGASLSQNEKIELAQQIAALGVDGIVVGVPMSSPGDFAAVEAIAGISRQWADSLVVAATARPIAADIETCWRAIRSAKRPRIIVACSPDHMGSAAGQALAPDEVVGTISAAIMRARAHCDDVQLSLNDAILNDCPALVSQVVTAAFDAGAGTVCLVDSRGYALPADVSEVVARLVAATQGAGTIGFHARDDLGLATANSLAAVSAGARHVECGITGFGDRAGNAALEELAMILLTRRATLPFATGIDYAAIYRTAQLVSTLAGNPIPPHKSVLGAKALPWTWSAAARRDGDGDPQGDILVLDPTLIGRPRAGAQLAAGLDAGALAKELAALGIVLDDVQVAAVHAGYRELGERKQTVTVEDLEALTGGLLVGAPGAFALVDFVITTGGTTQPAATVTLRLPDGGTREASADGDGPVDAMYRAVDQLTAIPVLLLDYALTAATSGKEALGQVAVKLEYKGQVFTGRGVSTDVLAASLRAYIHAINKIEAARSKVADFNTAKL